MNQKAKVRIFHSLSDKKIATPKVAKTSNLINISK